MSTTRLVKNAFLTSILQWALYSLAIVVWRCCCWRVACSVGRRSVLQSTRPDVRVSARIPRLGVQTMLGPVPELAGAAQVQRQTADTRSTIQQDLPVSMSAVLLCVPCHNRGGIKRTCCPSVCLSHPMHGLPHELRQCNAVQCFKSHLKTYHFRHHMDN